MLVVAHGRGRVSFVCKRLGLFKCSGERVWRERGWKDGGGVEGTGGYVDVGEVRSP